MALSALIFGFNTYRTVIHQNSTSLDFTNYAQFVEPIKHGVITKPHFIYPLLVAIWTVLFPSFSVAAAGGVIVIFFQLVLAGTLWWFWERELQSHAKKEFAIPLTVIAMIVAPIFLFIPDHHEYFGYILNAGYHNPPMLLCRPLALMNFLIFANELVDNAPTLRTILIAAATLIIAALMKPNYALIAVPVAVFYAIIYLVRNNFRMVKFIVFGMVFPGIVVLAWEFAFTYFSSHSEVSDSHIIFAPLPQQDSFRSTFSQRGFFRFFFRFQRWFFFGGTLGETSFTWQLFCFFSREQRNPTCLPNPAIAHLWGIFCGLRS